MRLLYSLHELLLENVNKTQFNYDKYVLKGKLPFDIFKKLIFADPTAQPSEYDWMSASEEDFLNTAITGKYGIWLLGQYANPKLPEGTDIEEYRRLILEDLPKINNLLTKHYRYGKRFVNPSQKDINNIKNINQLQSIEVKAGDDVYPLSKYSGKKKVVTPTGQQDDSILNRFQHEGSEIILTTPNYTVVKISDKGKVGDRAATYFGGYYKGPDDGETSWCTSMEDSSNFTNYIKQGPLYVIIPNNPAGSVFGGYNLPFGLKSGLPANRFQFHFPSLQFMDASDSPIFGNVDDLIELFTEGTFSEIKPFLKSELPKAFERESKDMKEFTYDTNKTNDNNQKLIALFSGVFGFKDFLNYISDDLTTFSVNNLNSDEETSIFDKLIRTKNTLRHLSITNSISELPDVFDGFNQLDSVFLRKNAGLRNLPESLLKLPNLKTIMVDEPINVSDIEKYGFVKREGSNGVFRKK